MDLGGALALTDTFLASALDRAAIVASTDVRGAIVHCNDLFCQISGYGRDELIGANHRVLNSGAHDRDFFTEMYRIIAHGGCWKGTICNRAKDGSLYWVDTTIVPQLDASGKPIGYVAIRFDVTEHIRALEALAQARMRAEAAVHTKARFLANVSHELRTPLTGILGMAHLLEATRLDPDQTECVAAIVDASGALQALVNDILDLARLEIGGVKIEPAPVDLVRLIDRLAVLVSGRAEAKGLIFRVEVGTPPERISVDGLRLRQVLTNLLTNAVKFTAEGFVALRVDWRDGVLLCEVDDSGPGFPPEDAERLFRPFEQGVETRDRAFGGVGLGLAISADLVRAMGGTLTASSCPGDGACFSVALPAPACAVEDAAPAAPASMPGGVPEHQRLLRVLVAEDNPTIQVLFQRILEAADCQVTLTSNGEEAVTAARERRFDLCLMDLRMPKMDGFAAVRAIRGLPRCSDLPIYAVSADVLDGQEAAEATDDFDGFLPKPLRPDLILGLVGSTRAKAA